MNLKDIKTKISDSANDSLVEQVVDELLSMAEAGTVGPDDIEGLTQEFGIQSEDWPDVTISSETDAITINGEDDGFEEKVKEFVTKSLGKKVTDSTGYPETLDELQDWGVSAESIVEEFDQWAPQDLKDEFMNSLADLFDGPESLDDSVCEYFLNTYGETHDYSEVVAELDQFLSSDELQEFIEDFDRAYGFSESLTGYGDSVDSGKSMRDIIETVVFPAIKEFKKK